MGVHRSEVGSHLTDSRLTPDLKYACRYWVYHLERCNSLIDDQSEAISFLEKYLLHWLEAMALLGRAFEIFHVIKSAETLVQPFGNTRCAKFLYDARRFAQTNNTIWDKAPLQVHSSSVLFAPETSMIGEILKAQIPRWIRRSPKAERDWSAQIQTLEGHRSEVVSIRFSLDGKLLASASHDGTVQLWSALTGQPLQTLKGHSHSVESVAFSPDGKLLAAASTAIHLWNISTRQPLQILERNNDRVDHVYRGPVDSISFSPDGKWLAAALNGQSIQLWDAATGQLPKTLRSQWGTVPPVVFSPTSKQLASGCGGARVLLWDMATGQRFQTPVGHRKMGFSVTYSPDGNQLASANQDKTIKLWDVSTGALLHTLKGHEAGINSVAFSPNGEQLAPASDDGTIRL